MSGAVEPGVDRRGFLVETALPGVGLAVGGLATSVSAATPAPLGKAGAAKLAALLTGKKDLPVGYVDRTVAALIEYDPAMLARLAELAARIERARPEDVEALRRSPLWTDEALRTTALALIGALYTGTVGQGPNARFVGFDEALAYRPTAGITPIPTLAGDGPGYWTKAPQP